MGGIASYISFEFFCVKPFMIPLLQNSYKLNRFCAISPPFSKSRLDWSIYIAVSDLEKLLDFNDETVGSLSREYASVYIFFFNSIRISSIILWGLAFNDLAAISLSAYCFIDAL